MELKSFRKEMKTVNENNNENMENENIANENVANENTANENIANENVEDTLNADTQDALNEEQAEAVEMVPEVKTKKKKSNLRGRNFKQGVYSSVVCVAVLVIVILVNLVVGQLDIKVDLTSEDVYTLTDKTKELVSGLSDDIEIYFLAKEGDEYKVLQNIINEYDKLPHIETSWKDPELYPQFASQYTDQEINGNDVIVVNKTTGASRFIPFNEMYISDYSINYTTQNYDYNYTLDAEGQITSAIQYVTSSTHEKMYVVSAHGETELGAKVTNLVNKANVEIATFDVMTQSAIPDDCNILFINGPKTDISDEELALYKAYLDNGGKAIFTVSYTDKDMKNYNELLAYYGVDVSSGVVLEKNGKFMNGYATYLVEGFDTLTEEISADFTMDDVTIVPIASIMKIQDASTLRGTLKVTSIISSSDGSYGKTNPESTVIEKEDSDPAGPFNLVVQATDTYKDKSSKVAIYATPYMLADDWIDYYSCKNIDMFIDTIDWMSEGTQESITIPQRSLDAVYLEVPQAQATIWLIITVVLVPLAILAAGFVVWYTRRKH